MLVEIGCNHVLGHLNKWAREWGSVCRMSLESLGSFRNTGRRDRPVASRTARLVCSPYRSIVSYLFYLCVCNAVCMWLFRLSRVSIWCHGGCDRVDI